MRIDDLRLRDKIKKKCNKGKREKWIKGEEYFWGFKNKKKNNKFTIFPYFPFSLTPEPVRSRLTLNFVLFRVVLWLKVF